MSRRALLCALLLLVGAGASVGQAPKGGPDPRELPFGENITTPRPQPKAKGLADLRAHMKAIEASLAKHGMAVDLERDDEVVVVTIPCEKLFAPNERELKPTGGKYLRPFLDFMKYPTMYKVLVAVYSDNIGEEAYLDDLTGDRAAAIAEFLKQESRTQGRSLVPYGMAADDPVEANDSFRGRAANRRAEIFIVPEWQMLDMARSGKLKQK